MKTLDELEKDAAIVRDRIKCQEIGNDSCYLSPIYHELIIKLEALNCEIDYLRGKTTLSELNFDEYPLEKRKILKKIAQEYGQCFVSNYKDLSLKDLRFLYALMKKRYKN